MLDFLKPFNNRRWLILLLESTAELILSKHDLLIFPILVFEWFTNLHDTWWGNYFLWYFIVTDASFS